MVSRGPALFLASMCNSSLQYDLKLSCVEKQFTFCKSYLGYYFLSDIPNQIF